jgi:hypothetical protein
MLKKLRRLSVGSVPVKQQIEIRIKTLVFDVVPPAPDGNKLVGLIGLSTGTKFTVMFTDVDYNDDDEDGNGRSNRHDQVLFAHDVIAIGFERERKHTTTLAKTLTADPPADVDFNEEALSLPVTFYKESSGKIMEKLGTLTVYKVSKSKTEPKLVLGQAALSLNSYFDETFTIVHTISLRIQRNNRPIGITLDCVVSAKPADPNAADETGSVSEYDEIASHSSFNSSSISPRIDGKTPKSGNFGKFLGFGQHKEKENEHMKEPHLHWDGVDRTIPAATAGSDSIKPTSSPSHSSASIVHADITGEVRPTSATASTSLVGATAIVRPNHANTTISKDEMPSSHANANAATSVSAIVIATPSNHQSTSISTPTPTTTTTHEASSDATDTYSDRTNNKTNVTSTSASKAGTKAAVVVDKDKAGMMDQILALRTECKQKQAAHILAVNAQAELERKLADAQRQIHQLQQQAILANESVESLTLLLNSARSELLSLTMVFTPKSKDDEEILSIKQQLEAVTKRSTNPPVLITQASLDMIVSKQRIIQELEAHLATLREIQHSRSATSALNSHAIRSVGSSISWEPDAKHATCMICNVGFTFMLRRLD